MGLAFGFYVFLGFHFGFFPTQTRIHTQKSDNQKTKPKHKTRFLERFDRLSNRFEENYEDSLAID